MKYKKTLKEAYKFYDIVTDKNGIDITNELIHNSNINYALTINHLFKAGILKRKFYKKQFSKRAMFLVFCSQFFCKLFPATNWKNDIPIL